MKNETEFERTFADLASAILIDKAPGLLDYLLGFQVLDVNEDQTKAVGVFACEVGNQLLYLPMFFLNGELKGHELMYITEQDLFVPMEESWVHYVLNRKPNKLGEGSDVTNKDFSGGSLFQFSRSPELGKAASSEPVQRSTVLIADGRTYPIYSKSAVHDTFKYAQAVFDDKFINNYVQQTKRAMDLTNFLGTLNNQEGASFFRRLRADDQLMSKVAAFYDFEAFKNLQFKTAAEQPSLDKGKEVKVHTKTDLSTATHLDDDAKEQLYAEGIYIEDHRGNTRKLYNKQTKITNSAVTCPGMYRVYSWEDAKPIDATVLKDSKNGDLLFLEGSNYLCCNASYEGSQIAGTLNPVENKEEYYENLPELGSVVRGDCIVIVEPDMHYQVKMLVDEVKRGEGNTILKGYKKCYKNKWEQERNEANYDICIIVSDGIEDLSVNQAPGDYPEKYVLSSKCKVHKFICPADDGYIKSHNLTKACDIEKMLWNNDLPIMDINRDMTTYTVEVKEANYSEPNRVQYFTKLSAIRGLLDFGLGKDYVKAALDAVDNVRDGESVEFFLEKKSNPFLDNPTGIAPQPSAQNMLFDSYYGAPTQTPQVDNTVVDSLVPTLGDAQAYGDPSSPPTPDMYAALDAAAATGQKEVFDTALLGTLVGSADPISVVDDYIGDLILGLDRIGKIYFLFLYHYASFAEQYGKTELIELEDNLKNVFKLLGNLVLFLKQKNTRTSKSREKTEIDGFFN